MNKQITNPIFSFGVCIPDGEPHVFNGRVYVYGSHDLLGGKTYCEGNYQVFSAPVDDLTSWSSKGISYDKKEDNVYIGKHDGILLYGMCVCDGG